MLNSCDSRAVALIRGGTDVDEQWGRCLALPNSQRSELQARRQLDNFIGWLERQPADGAYNYSDNYNCLVCQYLKSRGWKSPLARSYDVRDYEHGRHALPTLSRQSSDRRNLGRLARSFLERIDGRRTRGLHWR